MTPQGPPVSESAVRIDAASASTPSTSSAPAAPTDRPLAGQTAIVTGGGRGLGAAICCALSEAGAAVVVADVVESLARQTADALAAEGRAAAALPLDVTDADACRTAIDDVVARHGRLDILVNNAGIDVTAPITELRIEEWDRILQVNLRGPFVLSKLALTHLMASGRGQIVNIVSTAARRAWANATAYHASKWGLLGFSHALHVEGRAVGVKVSAVIAGGMRTPFLFERFPDLDPAVLQDPRHVADTVRYLLTLPAETVIPEVMVLPIRETSWP